MSLRTRVLALLVIIMAALGGLAWTAFHSARESVSEFGSLLDDRLAPSIGLGKMLTAVDTTRHRLMGVALDIYPETGSRHQLASDRAAVARHWQEFMHAHSHGLHQKLDETQHQLVTQIQQALPAFDEFLQRVDAAYADSDRQRLRELYDDQWNILHVDLVKPLRQLVDAIQEVAATEAQRHRDAMRRNQQLTGVVTVVSLTLVLVAGLLLLGRIEYGLRTVHDGIAALAANTYADDLPTDGKDEVADMVAAMNRTAAHLRDDRARILALKARNEQVLQAIGEGLYITDLEGNIRVMNPAGAALTGWDATELTGKPAHATLHHTHPDGSDYPREHCPLYATFTDGHTHRAALDWFWRRDGSGFEVELVSTPLLVDGVLVGAVVVFSDITERRAAEQELQHNYAELKALNARLEEAQAQLLQSEKMASIGQLAAGVAHEINNPVGFVNSNLGTLAKYNEKMLALIDAYGDGEAAISDPALRARIDELKQELDIDFLAEDLPALLKESEEGLQRVKKIVQDLKNFSHVDESEWQFADLNAGLESTLNVVWNEVKYKANVVKHYGQIPEVECLAAQLNQVFMNLIVNAVQALDTAQGMGTLTLSSGTEGDGVWVSVQDTGKGMSDDVRRRIFEPFYTTKPVGKGTGLGLSLSFSIIQKHHGRIEVESTPGVGTTFRVWVPLKRPPEPSETAT